MRWSGIAGWAVAATLLASPATAASGEPSCLAYEPAVVALEGRLARETVPGPPNYESIAGGDAPEVAWFVVLAKPVCVDGAPGDDVNVKESAVTRVQLVLEPGTHRSHEKLIGTDVQAKGTLFHGHTGHHHEKILMRVAGLTPSRPR